MVPCYGVRADRHLLTLQLPHGAPCLDLPPWTETGTYPRCQHNVSSVDLSPPQACLGHGVRGLPPSLLGSRLPDWTSLEVQWLRIHLLQEGNGSPLQFSCLENPMDRGAWWATVHGIARELALFKK